MGCLTPEKATVFGATGVAIRDLTTAGYALDEALKKTCEAAYRFES